jgi:hypothetical protein
MSEKGQFRKSMFSVQHMEELGRLYESDTPVLAYDFKRRMVRAGRQSTVTTEGNSSH